MYGFLMGWGVFWFLIWGVVGMFNWSDLEKPNGSPWLGFAIMGGIASTCWIIAVWFGHSIG